MALDDELQMLKELEVNCTCSECLGVFREAGMLEALPSCGHSFCLNCINERLHKIPLASSNTASDLIFIGEEGQGEGGDGSKSPRRLTVMVAVRCSTCLKLSKHPWLHRQLQEKMSSSSRSSSNSSVQTACFCSGVSITIVNETCNNGNNSCQLSPEIVHHDSSSSSTGQPDDFMSGSITAVSQLSSSSSSDQEQQQQDDCSTLALTTSSTEQLQEEISSYTLIPPAIIDTHRVSSSSDGGACFNEERNVAKSVVLRSASQLQLCVPSRSRKLQIFVKDLFGRMTMVTINADDTIADVKHKLAKIVNLPVAELNVRFFQQNMPPEAEDKATAAQCGIFNQATLRLLNRQPSMAAAWWRSTSAAASCLFNNPLRQSSDRQ